MVANTTIIAPRYSIRHHHHHHHHYHRYFSYFIFSGKNDSYFLHDNNNNQTKKSLYSRRSNVNSIKRSRQLTTTPFFSTSPSKYFHTTTTTTTATTTTTTTTEDEKHHHHQQQNSNNNPNPLAIFPWRHSNHFLPRLIPENSEYNLQGGPYGPSLPFINNYWPVPKLVHLQATSILGIPILDSLLTREWEQEMGYHFTFAFCEAVNGLKKMGRKNDDVVDDDDDKKDDDSSSSSSSEKELIPPKLEDMLDPQLLQLYQSTHGVRQQPSKYQITLETRPVRSSILSILSIPFTRDAVSRDPKLRHFYKKIRDEFNKKERSMGMMEFFNFVDREARALGVFNSQQTMIGFTVICQVGLECKERFRVVDLDLRSGGSSGGGGVIQGNEDDGERDVRHVVRFEIEVELDFSSREKTFGSWKITDWDDLLEGNIWFM